MASIHAMRTVQPAMDGVARTVLHGFLVALAVAAAALLTAFYVAHAGANPGIGADEASMYVLD